MCGIFGYVGQKAQAATIVLEGLKRLEYRGYDSWGIAVQQNSHLVVDKHAGKIADAHTKLPRSTIGIGHTRWATHGEVTDVNAHPHFDCTRTIAVIHNGIIENYEQLKKALLKRGHRFISETDTEVAAHLIEQHIKSMPFVKAVQKAFISFEGLNAIIALNAQTHEFVAARSGSPLVVGYGSNENYLASDATALIPHTRTVHFLEDDEMAIVSEKAVQIVNVKTGKTIKPKVQHIPWTTKQAEKGNYPHFMLKEIHEQPDIVAEIATTGVSQAEKVAKIIKESYGTYLVGCGTAAYACLAGTYLFSKIAHRHVNYCLGSEFSYQSDFLTPKSLVIALSQSGETMDTLEAAKSAKAQGAKIFALVNVIGSSLYRQADYKMLIGAGPEQGVASTKAFTGKLAHLILLACALVGKVEEGQSKLLQAVKSSRTIFKTSTFNKIKKLAKLIKDKEHVYVIGRGLSFPTSLETALKIKEISYIHAEGFAAGELKHGVIALVEKGTPCIVFLPNDETYGANLAGAMEMKARGGYIIGISHAPHNAFDYYIPVKNAQEATIIPNVIVGQLLAYYLTIEKGLNPDRPRNLAKSVTVK